MKFFDLAISAGLLAVTVAEPIRLRREDNCTASEDVTAGPVSPSITYQSGGYNPKPRTTSSVDSSPEQGSPSVSYPLPIHTPPFFSSSLAPILGPSTTFESSPGSATGSLPSGGGPGVSYPTYGNETSGLPSSAITTVYRTSTITLPTSLTWTFSFPTSSEQGVPSASASGAQPSSVSLSPVPTANSSVPFSTGSRYTIVISSIAGRSSSSASFDFPNSPVTRGDQNSSMSTGTPTSSHGDTATDIPGTISATPVSSSSNATALPSQSRSYGPYSYGTGLPSSTVEISPGTGISISYTPRASSSIITDIFPIPSTFVTQPTPPLGTGDLPSSTNEASPGNGVTTVTSGPPGGSATNTPPIPSAGSGYPAYSSMPYGYEYRHGYGEHW